MRTRWNSLVGHGDDAASLFQAICQQYGQPHRHYHTLDHVSDLLAKYDVFSADTGYASLAIEWAIWLHDVIYEPGSSRNETASADFARRWHALIDAQAPYCNTVCDLILATRAHDKADTADAQVLLDLDLSVLGADADTYHLYCDQIRREHAHTPRWLFRLGRRRFLNKMARRARIFHTEWGLDQFEARARKNIHAEILELRHV